MAWHGLEGHDEIVDRFRRALARRRLASTFLFAGPPGVGKRRFADTLAQALLCERHEEAALHACGECPSCLQVKSQSHPDYMVVECPPDKASIPIDLLIGEKDHRGESGVIHHLSLRPQRGKRKIAVIDDADLLAVEGVNAMLKTLEEPPPGSLLILVGTSPARQLPTIRSRCQLIRFRPLPEEVVARILVENELVDDQDMAATLARYCHGSVQWALELADRELWDFARRLFRGLARGRVDVAHWSPGVAEFVDKAGSQAPARRRRLRQLLLLATQFYRRVSGILCGETEDADPLFEEAARTAAGHWPDDATLAVACAERCLRAVEQVDRFANQGSLIDAWLGELDAMVARRASFVL